MARPRKDVQDPIARSRREVEAGDLGPEDLRAHLLGVHDQALDEVGETGVLSRMAVAMTLRLYGSSLASRDLLAQARALGESIRALGRLGLLRTLGAARSWRGAGQRRAMRVPPVRANTPSRPGAADDEGGEAQEAGDPADGADDSAA
jgi:hypothetical protein